MGFKVIVRKNGVQHGESHYTSEAVAAGMAKKMRNAGADVTLARCNGACCSGAKSNPRNGAARDPFAAVRRAMEKEVARYADEGGTFAQHRLMDAAYRVYHKHMTVTGEQLPVEAVVAEINAARERAEGLRKGNNAQELRRLADAEREAKRHRFPSLYGRMNPRRNGTSAGEMAASRSMVHRFGLSRNPSMDADTASTLIKQLGGMGKLVAMVGAKDVMRTERNGHPALSFKFKGSTKANYVIITLDPSDTYTLQFGKIVKYDLKPTGEFHGVYAAQLKPTFERFTGLYLSL